MTPLILNQFKISELVTKIGIAAEQNTGILLSVNHPSCPNINTALGFHDNVKRASQLNLNVTFETSGLISLNELVVMLAAKKENRKMGPNAHINFVINSGRSESGTADEQAIAFENTQIMREAVVNIIAENTELSVGEVKDYVIRKEYINFKEAAALGIL